MNDDAPIAARFETPEAASDYQGLVSGAIGAAGDLVSSIRDQVRESVETAHQSQATNVARITSGLLRNVAERTHAAGSTVSTIRQQLVDSVQGRINQAASLASVISNQVSPQVPAAQISGIAATDHLSIYIICCPHIPPFGVYDVVSGLPGLVPGDFLAWGGDECTIVAGPFATELAAIEAAALLPQPASCGVRLGDWWVCCCDGTAAGPPPPQGCKYTVTYTLDWPVDPPHDLDSYVKILNTGEVCYYDNRSSGHLVLNHDSFPDCNPNNPPPEQITGTFTESRRFAAYWNDFLPTCGLPVFPTTNKFVVTNIGTITINVNGHPIAPGDSATVNPAQDPMPDNQSGYQGGTVINVVCIPVPTRSRGSRSTPSRTAQQTTVACTTCSVVQHPDSSQKCIAGPFDTKDLANAWLIANADQCVAQCGGQPPPIKYSCINNQCVVDPNGQYATLAECQAVCTVSPGCCPQVIIPACPACPAPVVNVNVNAPTNITTITDTQNTWNNTYNDLRQFINDIRETTNNINTTNIDRSVTNIDNSLTKISEIIDSFNTTISQTPQAVAKPILHLHSDNSWTLDVDPNNIPFEEKWIEDTVNKIKESFTMESEEDLGDSTYQNVPVTFIPDQFSYIK